VRLDQAQSPPRKANPRLRLSHGAAYGLHRTGQARSIQRLPPAECKRKAPDTEGRRSGANLGPLQRLKSSRATRQLLERSLLTEAALVMTNSLAADHGAAPGRGIVVFAGLADRPLRAVRIDPMTAVWSADDLCVRVDRGERQDAECERHHDRTFREIFHSFFLHL
jgi:hypothetical protein